MTRKPSPAMGHYLLTRFNVPITYSSRPGLHGDVDWLHGRWELFQRYCLPSVQAQSTQDFTWLIFSWCGTPPEIKRLLDDVQSACRLIQVVYTATTPSQADIYRLLAPEHQAAGSYLLTSRLDNDDALAVWYLERIRHAAEKAVWHQRVRHGRPLAWNTPVGYQIHGGRPYLRIDPHSPFVSMLEKVTAGDPPRTIFSINHREVSTSVNTRQLSVRPAWLQVLHGDNIANQLLGVRPPWDVALGDFHIDLEEEDQSSGEHWLDVGSSLIGAASHYAHAVRHRVRR